MAIIDSLRGGLKGAYNRVLGPPDAQAQGGTSQGTGGGSGGQHSAPAPRSAVDSSLPLPTGRSASQTVTDIVLRRDESKRWLRMNVWDEWVETWRMIKCRTKPIYKRDSAGKETSEEDKSRTNVEMGLMNLIFRKNVARLSAQPYSLRVIGGQDPTVGPRFSAVLSQQYDRSKERMQDVRVRMSAEALGVGYSKLYWDWVVRNMTMRRALVTSNGIAYRDRKSVMQRMGASDDEIEGAVAQKGEDLTDDEVAQYIGKSGNEITVPQEVTKYEGPCVKYVFPGDLYREPFAKVLADSSYLTESYRESDLWLKRMLKVTYKDPDTGKEMKAFDPDAIAQLERMDPEPVALKGEYQELRDLFRTSIGKQDQLQYQFPRNLRVRKMYDILEEHTQDEDGRMWVCWISEVYRDKPLGRMPYPWDLYGQSVFTEEVPLPDMIDAIGDSTPRLLRFQNQMFNVQAGQNWDYITNTIKKILLVKTGVEFEDEVIERGLFRIMRTSDLNGHKYLEDPPLPVGAMERGEGLLQLISMFEPSLAQSDNIGNPIAGKTATASVLNAKASDALLNFKMEGRNLYLWDLGMKKLWMNQQAAQDAWEVEQKHWGQQLGQMVKDAGDKPPEWALSDRMGKTSAVRIDPMEIQEDLQVEPESGSYMSVDDDLRRSAAQDMAQIATQAPNVIDVRKVARFALSTIRGIGNPDDYILPPPGPQPPQPKVNFNFTGKMEDFPSVAAAVMQEMGMQTPNDINEQEQLNTLKRVSEAADHATNLLSPAHEPETPVGQAQAEVSA